MKREICSFFAPVSGNNIHGACMGDKMTRHRILYLLLIAMLLAATFFAAGCGDDDDDDDNSGTSPVDDDDTADDDTSDDDDTQDDDDAIDDDDVVDDDDIIDDDDIADDDDVVDDDDSDDDDFSQYPTTEGYTYIPAGSFVMGSAENEPGHRFNETEHTVTLDNHFEMKETEVTQAEFEAALGFNPSKFPKNGSGDAYPVEQVTWFDALAYANVISADAGYAPCYTLTDIECEDESAGDTTTWCKGEGGIASATVALNGVTSVYDCEGFRLPTEAEWEHAARADTTTTTFAGNLDKIDCIPIDPTLDDIAWYCGNADKTTHEVAQKDDNPWDLFDLFGNVAEWTWDFYANDITAMTQDPEGPATGEMHVVRGGAYRYYAAARMRAAYRAAHTADYRVYLVGFRTVRTLPEDFPPLRPATVAKPIAHSVKATATKALPDELPFDFTRPQAGTPLTSQEVTDFSQAIVDFWAETDFFRHLRWTTHGMVAGNPDNYPDFKLYYQLGSFVKSGDLVTFNHADNSDNLFIRTGKFINNLGAAYLATGDENMGYLTEQYCKGLVALVRGFEWYEDDPEIYTMPRTIFPSNHYYTENGRQAYVNYDPIKSQERYDWNGWTIPNPTNPTYGSIWVRTMRSKDDHPSFQRIMPILMRLVEDPPDVPVQEAAEEALHYMREWHKDIVDSGYYIRTKDNWGNIFIPLTEDGLVNDLASLTQYRFVDEKAECNARLASALIGYESPLDHDCGNGISWLVDPIFGYINYYNERNIVRLYHVAAVGNALMEGENAMAEELLDGLATKADLLYAHSWPQADTKTDWDADTAAFLLASATVGLPLTADETRLVVDEYTLAMEHYSAWQYWDPWSPTVPDGSHQYSPSQDYSATKKVVRMPEMTFPLEYCYSPLRNETTSPLFDCDVILNPANWTAQ